MGKIRKNTVHSLKPRSPWLRFKNDEAIAQIASRFGVHPTMVSSLKWQVLEGAADIFYKNHNFSKQAQNDELYRQIGKLKVENDFL